MHDGQKQINENVDVKRIFVTYAKMYLTKQKTNLTGRAALEEFLKEYEAEPPKEIILHSSVDPEVALKQAAKSISYRLAFCEAVWELIGVGLLIPGGTTEVEQINPIPWTTIVPGQGGQRASWSFNQYTLNIPQRLIFPKSNKMSPMPLTDCDLYLKELRIENLHEEIERSLREAIHCFRFDLYLACLAMLGKAVEGAWLELGMSLALHIDDAKKRDKYYEQLQSPFNGLAKKIKLVLEVYSKTPLESIRTKARVKVDVLNNVAFWSDSVRESRNNIHFGAEPPMENTYEKVATLLIGAVPNLSTLYRIKNVADKIKH